MYQSKYLNIYTHEYICMHVNIYVYIHVYTYIHIERGRTPFIFLNKQKNLLIIHLFGIGLSER